MSAVATKKPKPDADGDSAKRYPSRENIRYVGLPKELYEALKKHAESQERSASWMAMKFVRDGLTALDLWHAKPKSDQKK